MPPALQTIGTILGIVNTVQGLQSQGASQRALSQASGLTEEQAQEIRVLRAILSDSNHPMRQILRAQAESGIGRAVSTGSNQLLARLAASGFRGQSAGAPLALLASRGVMAQGDLERQLINDFIQKRIGLVGGPDVALRGGLSIADIAGRSAGASGEALGGLLELLKKLQRTPTGTTPVFVPSYAGIGPGGLETYRTGRFFLQ